MNLLAFYFPDKESPCDKVADGLRLSDQCLASTHKKIQGLKTSGIPAGGGGT